jgi:Spy/CpxP family protein refolding chaperone
MKKTVMMVALLASAARLACAQQPPPGQPGPMPHYAPGPQGEQPGGDPFGRYLYPPELVMAHQEAIGLTDRQRSAIQEAVKEMQNKAVDTQFKLASVSEKLVRSLGGATVDEASVLQFVDQVLAAEREVKRAQISLLVRIKNQLTPEQQATLDRLRRQG